MYLVQELATEGDLYRKGGAAGSSRYNEHKVINSILVPMLSALQYLHERVGLIRVRTSWDTHEGVGLACSTSTKG